MTIIGSMYLIQCYLYYTIVYLVFILRHLISSTVSEIRGIVKSISSKTDTARMTGSWLSRPAIKVHTVTILTNYIVLPSVVIIWHVVVSVGVVLCLSITPAMAKLPMELSASMS